jgi:hypothetical protein
MNKTNGSFSDLVPGSMWLAPGPNERSSGGNVHIADKRVAQLLLVLHELDESVAGLEELPKAELSDLISRAILACGFVDPIEARYAIAAVLEAIGANDSTTSPDIG